VLTGACSTFGFVENIKDEHHDKAHELLKSLNAENIYKSKYGVLSQGEKQKVLIARSMISNPELLIFDEPCSGLDIPSREHMLSTLNEIPQKYNNTTLILITHHIEEIVPVFNKVMILKDGEKFSAGDKKEILTKDILTPALGINLDVDKQAERYWLRVKH
jgi:iron complex transport system ATP-binding protein